MASLHCLLGCPQISRHPLMPSPPLLRRHSALCAVNGSVRGGRLTVPRHPESRRRQGHAHSHASGMLGLDDDEARRSHETCVPSPDRSRSLKRNNVIFASAEEARGIPSWSDRTLVASPCHEASSEASLVGGLHMSRLWILNAGTISTWAAGTGGREGMEPPHHHQRQ